MVYMERGTVKEKDLFSLYHFFLSSQGRDLTTTGCSTAQLTDHWIRSLMTRGTSCTKHISGSTCGQKRSWCTHRTQTSPSWTGLSRKCRTVKRSSSDFLVRRKMLTNSSSSFHLRTRKDMIISMLRDSVCSKLCSEIS